MYLLKKFSLLAVAFATFGIIAVPSQSLAQNAYNSSGWDPIYPLVGGPVGTPYPYDIDIARDPNDVPPMPLANEATVEIRAQEIEAYLAPRDHAANWAGDGTDVKFIYFAFGGGQTSVTDAKVPGPFIRVTEGNTLTVRFVNEASNLDTHSIDLHAVLGLKGGAAVLMAEPGETKELTFVVKNPGIYVYHCVGNGTPVHIALHENNGMYGLILVEPLVGTLWNDVVDLGTKEFYVFEQDLYYDGATKGFDEAGMLEGESPDYTVYNGRIGSLVDMPLAAEAGKHAIIYHGAVGTRIPSFHIIGEIFDAVWREGDLISPPARNVQTAMVPSSGAIAVVLNGADLTPTDLAAGELNILVDHALPAFRKGALGLMTVSP